MSEASEYRQLFDRITFTGSIVLATIVAGLLCWGIYYSRQYEGLVTIDALDQAQVARHFYRGEGFTTGFIKPVSILRGETGINGPDLYNSPIPISLISIFFKIMEPNDLAVLGNSIFWAFLTGLLLFIFTRLLFRNLFLALLTFLMYMFNPGVLESTFSGLPISFVGFTLLLLTVFYYFRNRSSIIWTASLGILAGILFLSEFDFLFLSLLIGFLVVYDSKGKRSLHALAFAIPYLLVIFPWLIRNGIVAGNPLATLRWFDFKIYSLLYPGNMVARDYNPALFTTTLPITIFWNKFLRFNRLMYLLWPSLSHSILVPFFLGGVLLHYNDGRWARVIRFAVLLFFCQLILIAAGNGDFARLLYFMPLVIIGGVAAFLQLLGNIGLSPKTVGGDSRRSGRMTDIPDAAKQLLEPSAASSQGAMRYAPCAMRKKYWIVISIFFFLTIFPGVITLIYGLPEQRYVSTAFTKDEATLMKGSKSMEKIQSLMKEDEVVVSDIPWAIAWYANRSAIWIPWEIDQMKAIKNKVRNIRFLHLTPMIFKYPDIENVDGWREIYKSGMVPEWLNVDRGILLPGDHLIMGDIIFERLNLE